MLMLAERTEREARLEGLGWFAAAPVMCA